MFNATFNNIFVISWRSLLLMEYQEKAVDLPQVTDKLYHTEYTYPWTAFEPTTLVLIGTDCMGCCKSRYNTMTTPPQGLDFVLYTMLQLSGRRYIIFVRTTMLSHTYSQKYKMAEINCLKARFFNAIKNSNICFEMTQDTLWSFSN